PLCGRDAHARRPRPGGGSVSLLLRAGEWDAVTRADGRWSYLSFRVLRVDGRASLETADEEGVIVPLAGDVVVRADGVDAQVAGRADVVASRPRSIYLPRDTRAEIAGSAA